MKNYIHHGNTSCYEHCISVAFLAFKMAKKFKSVDCKAVARGGLLHDLFLYDWKTHGKETGDKFHGFTHPRAALNNAEKITELADKERDIILHHMWPLTITLPR